MVYCLVEVQYFASQELTCRNNRCQQAISLKFRLVSIQFTSEALETGRKMSETAIFQQSGRRLPD
jgi:hypothetical protein